jgi:DNA polymerase III epsilon subunit-like protein
VPTTQTTPPPIGQVQLVRADLTRNPTPYPASAATFTAIDVETTGLDPDTARIVEIGLVKFSADGTVIDEFATLVNNPGSPAEARAVHGIEDDDLVDAPTTAQALQEAFALMDGTVFVAHNLEYVSQGVMGCAATVSRPRCDG